MAKLAICVKSCHRDLDAGHHDAIRGAWGRDAKANGVDVFFFVGHDPNQADSRRIRRYVSGEVLLDCRDDYESLPTKTRRICQWAMGKMFPYLFLCDNDTFVKIPQLLKTGFEKSDYSGYFRDHLPGEAPFNYSDPFGEYPGCRAWASGGIGYFLSRKAVEIVAADPPTGWAEDMWVGQVLADYIDKKEIKAEPLDIKRKATWHFEKMNDHLVYKPEFMKLAYENPLKNGWDSLYASGVLK